MFIVDMAFAIELMAIATGVGLTVWSLRHEGAGIQLAKVSGYAISVLALFALLCTTYYGIMYWNKGYYKASHDIRIQMPKNLKEFLGE